jgi:Ni/Co efflux regulator RcnB
MTKQLILCAVSAAAFVFAPMAEARDRDRHRDRDDRGRRHSYSDRGRHSSYDRHYYSRGRSYRGSHRYDGRSYDRYDRYDRYDSRRSPRDLIRGLLFGRY